MKENKTMKTINKKIGVWLFGFMLMGSSALVALTTVTTVDINTTKDTYISGKASEQGNNYNNSDEIKAKNKTNNGDIKRGLIQWDLSNDIPEGATITEANIAMHTNSNKNDDIDIRRITTSWIETEATWKEAQNGTDWSDVGG